MFAEDTLNNSLTAKTVSLPSCRFLLSDVSNSQAFSCTTRPHVHLAGLRGVIFTSQAPADIVCTSHALADVMSALRAQADVMCTNSSPIPRPYLFANRQASSTTQPITTAWRCLCANSPTIDTCLSTTRAACAYTLATLSLAISPATSATNY